MKKWSIYLLLIIIIIVILYVVLIETGLIFKIRINPSYSKYTSLNNTNTISKVIKDKQAYNIYAVNTNIENTAYKLDETDKMNFINYISDINVKAISRDKAIVGQYYRFKIVENNTDKTITLNINKEQLSLNNKPCITQSDYSEFFKDIYNKYIK